MALWLYIMRQIEMKMRRVSQNSFWQQRRVERRRGGGLGGGGGGGEGLWLLVY